MTCAFAVRGALRKIPGVETVDVSLNKGLASVKLKPGNTVTAEQFWEAVKRNGFTPKDTRVVVRGDVASSAGKLQLKVAGTGRTYELVASPSVLEDAKRLAGKTISIEGTLTPSKEPATAAALRVAAVRQ